MDLHIEGLSGLVEIGAGANGIVYRAMQSAFDRPVAVKVVRAAYDADSLGRFNQEREALATMSPHPGLAPVLASGATTTGEPYLVVPYYAAGSLAGRMAQSGPLPWATACELVVKAANAAEHAHSAGVTHRDIQPSNILLDEGNQPVLTDFGIATLADRRDVSPAPVAPAYAPPEAFNGAAPNRRFDVYSLGATLHALIAGRPPFVTDDVGSRPQAIQAFKALKTTGSVPDLRQLAPGEVCRVIERAMATDPAERHQSASELAGALQAAMAATGADSDAAASSAQAQAEATTAAPGAPGAPSWDPPSDETRRAPAPWAPPPQPAAPPHLGSPPQQPAPPPFQQPAPFHAPPSTYGTPDPQAQTISVPGVSSPADPVQPGPGQPSGGLPGHAEPGYPPTNPQAFGGYGSAGFGSAPPGPPPGYVSTDPNTFAAPGRPRRPWLTPLIVVGAIVVLGGIGAAAYLAAQPDDSETETTTVGNTPQDEDPDETAGETTTPPSSTETSDETTESSAPADDRTEGAVTALELRAGDCIDIPLNAGIFDTVNRRPCDESHNAEVTGVLQHPDAGGEYPGQLELTDYAFTQCGPIFENYVGIDEFSSELISSGLSPTFDEWQDGIFVLPCVATRWDESSLNASVAGRADDPAISLDNGDAIYLHRLNFGACFVTPPPSVGDGLAQQDGLAQIVEVASCDTPYEGEVIGSASVVGTADGSYVFDPIYDEATSSCQEQFTLYTGIATDTTGGLFPIIPDRLEWESGAKFTICILLNTEGRTGSAAAGATT